MKYATSHIGTQYTRNVYHVSKSFKLGGEQYLPFIIMTLIPHVFYVTSRRVIKLETTLQPKKKYIYLLLICFLKVISHILELGKNPLHL